jgi:hypothetical protein
MEQSRVEELNKFVAVSAANGIVLRTEVFFGQVVLLTRYQYACADNTSKETMAKMTAAALDFAQHRVDNPGAMGVWACEGVLGLSLSAATAIARVNSRDLVSAERIEDYILTLTS